MVLAGKNVKRLVIYFFYDRQGIVDDYVPYMLNDLKKNATELVVVCNGKINADSRKKLEEITPLIIVRENKGFDVWAYKTVLEYYGWEKLYEYDEVVMMNFTIMGPIYPLSEMFEEMEKRDLDFWGITKFGELLDYDPFDTIEYGYIPTHIQSHFIAVRNRMLRSIEFRRHWDNMKMIHNYAEAVGFHEAVFTKKFSDAGFIWDVYADLDEDYNRYPLLCAARKMLEEQRCPIFKRRSFFQDYDTFINETLGESTIEALEFIENHTDYDVNMIWDNILRLENLADIKNDMQLNFVIDNEVAPDISDIIKSKKIALVLHLYFEELAEYCLHYVASMPKEADVYVTVDSEKKKKIVEEIFAVLPNRVQVIIIENRGRDVSALLVGTKEFILDYDYVCFVHDKKVVQVKPETVGAGFSYKCFENLLSSKAFVKNVLHAFEENQRLGFLMPPPPNHGDYYGGFGQRWGLNFQRTKELAEKLELTVPMSEEKEPVAPLGTMFWFRPKALKLLFEQDWKYEDFPKEPNKTDGTVLHAIERIYCYVVQQEGYYSGWVFSSKGAKIEITNLHHMLSGINKEFCATGPGLGYYAETLSKIHKSFVEWRMCHSALGYTEGGIIVARLYLKKENKYTEEDSIVVENTSDLNQYVYDDMEKYGKLDGVRWDPGEKAGIIIRSLNMCVTLQNERVLEFSMKDAVSNGMFIKGELVFLGPDPQLMFKWKEELPVKKIVIKADIVDHITMEKAEFIYRKIAKRSIVRRIVNKLVN